VERLVVVGSVGLGFGGGVWPAGVVAAMLVVAAICRLREASRSSRALARASSSRSLAAISLGVVVGEGREAGG
jgi:hypothetical protein